MAEHERRRIRFEDGEGNVLHAVWSRVGGLRLHVGSSRSPERVVDAVMGLTVDQVEHLKRFLCEGA